MSIGWYPGHMAAARKKLAESMAEIDVVVEVLDARLPVAKYRITDDGLPLHSFRTLRKDLDTLAYNVIHTGAGPRHRNRRDYATPTAPDQGLPTTRSESRLYPVEPSPADQEIKRVSTLPLRSAQGLVWSTPDRRD